MFIWNVKIWWKSDLCVRKKYRSGAKNQNKQQAKDEPFMSSNFINQL